MAKMASVRGRNNCGQTLLVVCCAALVAWLASEECSFSTGAVFDLSGGRAVY
jgi:3-oxoacyl-[acyl-carrier protein] reductase